MKNVFLTTAVVTTLVGNAFGAASLRAQQLGGGATATPTTAPATTARAGTLRAQTMKTSMSTSTAAPTVTASVSEPVADETTDARLSFLKSVKGFNPGKVKDTTTTQQELNAIDSRIEELQSKLDAAESAQATVLTEDTIDAKIDEKLTALGTSTSAKDTYSKTEINKLLPYKKDGLIYLPVLPNQPSSGDVGTAEPTVIAPERLFTSHGFDQSSDGLVTIYKYITTGTNNEITDFVNEFCHDIDDGDAYWCSKYGNTTVYNQNSGERLFKILKRHHGYKYVTVDYTYGGGAVYTTNERDSNGNPTTYINTHICGNSSGTDTCHVQNYHENSGTDFANYTVNVSTGAPNVFQYLSYNSSPSVNTTSAKYGTNASVEAIESFAAQRCGNKTERWCALVDIEEHTTGQYARTFRIVEREIWDWGDHGENGYADYNGHNWLETFEHNGVTYLRMSLIANTDKGSTKAREMALDLMGCNSPYYSGGAHSCYITSIVDNCANGTQGGVLPCNTNLQDHYSLTGIREIEVEAQLPEPLQD